MSASFESMPGWRKRSHSISDNNDSTVIFKKRKLDYFYVLETESSSSENEDTESVESIQDKETDYCKDTSDTDSKSENSDGVDIEIEYDVISTSETEENPFASGSSSGDDDILVAAGAVASAITNNRSDLDIWITDGDDETDSASSSIDVVYQMCKKCKIRKTVSVFPLCSHCYQMRKNCYPPRPKHKKMKNRASSRSSNKTQEEESTNNDNSTGGSVTTKSLSACLNVLSQDSGVGSSQEIQPPTGSELQTLAWDEVVVPENLIKSSENIETTTSSSLATSSSETVVSIQKVCYDQTVEDWISTSKECIMCHENPKNGIFVHSTGGHICCCYKCAVKSWTKTKRCALCNLKAKNVIKAFLA